jgi:hypothetical protein
MLQECTLSDTRLTAQDDDTTLTGERICQEAVECFAFSLTSEEPRR